MISLSDHLNSILNFHFLNGRPKARLFPNQPIEYWINPVFRWFVYTEGGLNTSSVFRFWVSVGFQMEFGFQIGGSHFGQFLNGPKTKWQLLQTILYKNHLFFIYKTVGNLVLNGPDHSKTEPNVLFLDHMKTHFKNLWFEALGIQGPLVVVWKVKIFKNFCFRLSLTLRRTRIVTCIASKRFPTSSNSLSSAAQSSPHNSRWNATRVLCKRFLL